MVFDNVASTVSVEDDLASTKQFLKQLNNIKADISQLKSAKESGGRTTRTDKKICYNCGRPCHFSRDCRAHR
ncbi:hypothetical protein XELAEV_18033287mg [Xenopus laevis]|uniref:CCHC-type domain-containing protein n=1 Tax=Xenopus laevis TaxID=8355 RepID=A0A974CJM9_XENLA|nr:hypothetical protein XELAEV_18033287mg [Xenopus laevis]